MEVQLEYFMERARSDAADFYHRYSLSTVCSVLSNAGNTETKLGRSDL